jgi:hypothetical protein
LKNQKSVTTTCGLPFRIFYRCTEHYSRVALQASTGHFGVQVSDFFAFCLRTASLIRKKFSLM